MPDLTSNEVAARLGITRARILTLARTGRFKHAYKHSNVWFIPERDVAQFKRLKPYAICKHKKTTTSLENNHGQSL